MSAQQPSSQAQSHPGTAPDSRPFVLVVDDEPQSRILAARILEAEGFHTVCVEDGLAARDLINTGTTPDLVLTDLKMPRMDGAELGRILGQLRPGLPMVYMSGFASQSTALLSPEILRNCYIEKPFKPAALVVIVSRCMKPSDRIAG